jgi:AraC-like DNA-binding protein
MEHTLADLRELRYELAMAYDAPVYLPSANRTDFLDPHYASWWIRAGTVWLRTGESELRAGPETWVICDPFYTRSQHFEPDTRILSIRFKLSWRGMSYLPPPRAPLLSRTAPPRLLERAEALVAACGGDSLRDARFELSGYSQVQSLFHAWLETWHAVRLAHGAGTGGLPSHDARTNRLLSELARQPGLGPVDYERLCAALDLSRAQVDRVCRERLGATPRHIRERQCLDLAEGWLQHETYSIKEIAYRLHFVDSSHFAKWFKKKIGVAPAAYRRRHGV